MNTNLMNSALLKSAVLASVASALLAGSAHAASNSRKAPTPRDVEVDSVKEAYWNRTSDGDVEVVQNRLYSKKNRLSLSAMAGTVSADPFLNVKSAAASLGFHFSETFGVSAIYRKFVVSDSSYLQELQSGKLVTNGPAATANTNIPNAFYGGEIEYSPLYGKISLSGSSIVHYDAHLLLGAGITDTESGKYVTPTIGFGPQFYLGNSVAIRADYRLAIYKENIPQKNPVLTSGIVGSRTNYSHQVAIGLELFL